MWRQLFAVAALVLAAAPVPAADRVIAIFGKSGDETMLRKAHVAAETLRRELPGLGFAPESITILDENSGADRKKLEELFRSAAAELTPNDRCWIFLFGHLQQGRDKLWFRLPHGVLDARELKTWLDLLPPREQLLFALTSLSFELQELLKGSNRTVIAAAATPGEKNPPRLPDHLLGRLAAPGDGWIDLLRDAALDLQRTAGSENIYLSESAFVATPSAAAGYPFLELTDAMFPARRAETVDGKDRDSCKLPVGPPLTSEPFYSQSRTVEIVGTDGRSGTITERNTLVLNSADAAARFAVFHLPRAAGTEIRFARSVNPAGQVTAAKFSPSGRTIRFGKLAPGSRIEYEYTLRLPVGTGGAELFNRACDLAAEYPQRKLEFSISAPLRQQLRFKAAGIAAPDTPTVTESPYNRKYTFTFDTLAPLPRLGGVPTDRPRAPRLLVSTWGSWEEFGNWYRSLAAGTEQLTPAAAAVAAELTSDETTPPDKLRKLYDHLNSLRYDTDWSGIRALRPRLVDEVLSSGYGDCKDKANALAVLAGAIGIEGYPALLNRGGVTDPEFPAWQFNHMVVCFPRVEGIDGPLWLDATDTETPFGTLPPGDTGRFALLLKPGKPEFLQIRPTREEDNLLRHTFVFEPGKPGIFRIEGAGLFRYRLRHALKNRFPAELPPIAQALLDGCLPRLGVLSADANDGTPTGELEPAASPPSPQPPSFLTNPFALPTRNVPLELNDGQAFRFEESVTYVKYGKMELPPNREMSAGPVTLRQTWLNQSGGHTLRRTELVFSAGVIESADYPAVRNLIHELIQ